MNETDRQARCAADRSTAYAILAYAFRYPDAELLDRLNSSEGWRDALGAVRRFDPQAAERLAALHDEGGEHDQGGSVNPPSGNLVNSRMARNGGLTPSAGPTWLESLQERYVTIFGHAVRGTCPLYELEFGQGEIVQQAPLLADITGFYAAFGMTLTEQAHERADHVSVECEYMSVMAAKHVFAAEQGSTEALDVLGKAERSFLADHLGRWFPALARRVQDTDPNGFYGAMGRFAAAFIAEECGRFEVPLGPQFLELRPADPELDATIACGVEESCPDGQAEPLVQIGIEGN